MKKTFTRALALVLTLMLLLPVIIPCASAAGGKYYTDVSPNNTDLYNAVNYLYEHGIMNGTGDSKFSPSDPVTRGQIVTIMWRMLHKPTVSGTVTFTDCKSSDWLYNAVQWAQSAGIASGYTDGTFRPNQTLTNQELYVFMHRFIKYCGYKVSPDSTYRDVFRTRVSKRTTYQTYAYAAAGWVNYESLLDNKKIAGNTDCTRGDAALLVYNIYKKYQKKYGMAMTVANYFSDREDWFDGAFIGDQLFVDDKQFMKHMADFYARSGVEAICSTRVRSDNKSLYYDDDIHFSTLMDKAFSKANKLDICYIHMSAHGSVKGLHILDYSGSILTPAALRTAIDKYDGLFVVMISACHSGTFFSQNGGKDLSGSHRIKVLCSSAKESVSLGQGFGNEWYSIAYNEVSSYSWGIGFGYDYFQNRDMRELCADLADTGNGDDRISLKEMYNFSIGWLQQNGLADLTVCYPENDDTIIYELSY